MTLILLLLACHRTQAPPSGSTELDLAFPTAALEEARSHPVPMPAPPSNLPMPTGAFRPWIAEQATDCHLAFELAEAGLEILSRTPVEQAGSFFERTEGLVLGLKGCETDAVLRVPARVRAADLNRMAASWLAEHLAVVEEEALVEDLASLRSAAEAGYRGALIAADGESPWASHARWALVELQALR